MISFSLHHSSNNMKIAKTGATLIEVLISLTLFSLALSMVFSINSLGNLGFKKTSQSMHLDETSSMVLDKIINKARNGKIEISEISIEDRGYLIDKAREINFYLPLNHKESNGKVIVVKNISPYNFDYEDIIDDSILYSIRQDDNGEVIFYDGNGTKTIGKLPSGIKLLFSLKSLSIFDHLLIIELEGNNEGYNLYKKREILLQNQNG